MNEIDFPHSLFLMKHKSNTGSYSVDSIQRELTGYASLVNIKTLTDIRFTYVERDNLKTDFRRLHKNSSEMAEVSVVLQPSLTLASGYAHTRSPANLFKREREMTLANFITKDEF